MLKKFFAAAAVALLVAGASRAATITYTLDLSVPGTYNVYGDASAGDNFGIAVWGVQLKATGGQILTEDNRSPLGARTNGQALGFSDVRFPAPNSNTDINGIPLTPDDNTPSSVYSFSGGQLVASGPTGNFVYGLGQSAGSFATQFGANYSPTNSSFQDGSASQAWVPHILLASGTYSGTLAFDNQNNIGNAWSAQGGARTAPGATVSLVTIPPAIVPEPATLTLLGLAVVGGLGLRRRSA